MSADYDACVQPDPQCARDTRYSHGFALYSGDTARVWPYNEQQRSIGRGALLRAGQGKESIAVGSKLHSRIKKQLFLFFYFVACLANIVYILIELHSHHFHVFIPVFRNNTQWTSFYSS